MPIIAIEANRSAAIPHWLGLGLVAAMVSTPLGCGSRELLPTETDPTTGSPPSTGNGDDGKPAVDTGSLDHTGPGNTSITGPSTTGATEPGTTSDTGPGVTSDTGASTTGSTGVSADETGESCELNDEWEPNNLMETVLMTRPDYYLYGLQAYLCPGESDWYLHDTDGEMHDLNDLEYEIIVAGSSVCCDDPLPEAPENTVAIAVYDADTLVLLEEGISADGAISGGGSGDAYSGDLLLHIYSPTPTAAYSYMVFFEVYHYDGEDECEC